MRTIFLVLIAAVACMAASKKKIVCYWISWYNFRSGAETFSTANIDPFLCTHLVYGFGWLTEKYQVNASLTSDMKKEVILMNALRKKNQNLQTMIALGGYATQVPLYSKMVASAELRKRFIDSAVKFLKQYKFNGLVFDWQYPAQFDGSNPNDKENFVLCLNELKKRFMNESLILSVTVAAQEPSAKTSYNIPELSIYVDFINLNTFDFHDSSTQNITGFNAPLYVASSEKGKDRQLNVNASVYYWLSQGAPKEKLIVGIPLYGRTYTLVDPKNNGVGAATTGGGLPGPYTNASGALGFYEICDLQKKKNLWTIYSSEQRVPYIIDNNQWISFDNVKSVTEKANFINKMGLGGAMAWSIETDDFRNICRLGTNPILNTLKSVLRSS